MKYGIFLVTHDGFLACGRLTIFRHSEFEQPMRSISYTVEQVVHWRQFFSVRGESSRVCLHVPHTTKRPIGLVVSHICK